MKPNDSPTTHVDFHALSEFFTPLEMLLIRAVLLAPPDRFPLELAKAATDALIGRGIDGVIFDPCEAVT